MVQKIQTVDAPQFIVKSDVLEIIHANSDVDRKQSRPPRVCEAPERWTFQVYHRETSFYSAYVSETY